MPDGFYLWGWNTGVTHIDSRGNEKGRIRTLRPICELKSIRRKKQFFVIHDSLNLGLYRLDGAEVWRARHPVPIDFSQRCADIDISDCGRAVAITAFEKGVYIYNAQNCSLKNLELDKPVVRAAVSRNGEMLLLGDPFGTLYLASEDNHIYWQERLKNEALYCRLDQEGQRALVFEKGGILSSFAFFDGKEERSSFLELKTVNTVPDKNEIWKKSYYKQKGPLYGNVALSGNGERILFYDGKTFFLYDFDGKPVWQRSFMTRFDNAFLSDDGNIIFMVGDKNIYVANLRLEKERHLTFYRSAIKTFSFDGYDGKFLIVDKRNSISLYNSTGKKLWTSALKKISGAAILCGKKNSAIMRISDNCVYIINLESLKAKKVSVDQPFTKMSLGGSAFYLWGVGGKILSIGFNGSLRWEYNSKLNVRDVTVIKNKIILRGQALRTILLNDKGVLLHKGKMRSSSSIWNHYSRDLLEITPEKTMVTCRNFQTGKILWKANVSDELKAIAVGRLSDRMGILGADFLYYHYILEKPGLDSGDTSFLEF